MRRARRTSWSRTATATAFALLGHLVFIGLLLLLSQIHLGPPSPAREIKRPVTLRALTAKQWAANRVPRQRDTRSNDNAREQAVVPPKKPEKKPEPLPQGQVVATAPGNGEEDPNAKYLAESSNRVKHQTKAKDQTAFYRNAMPQRTSTTPQNGVNQGKSEQLQISGNQGIGNDDRPLNRGGEQKRVFEIPDVKHRDELAMKIDKNGVGPGAAITNHHESDGVSGNSNRLRIQDGAAGAGSEERASQGRAGQPNVMNLMPSMTVLDKISGAAPNDHLEDVDDGNGTYLNTREWKYASFFNRVKQSVGQHWDPQSQLRQRDPTGTTYGGRDRYTVVQVTLDDRGKVKEIYIEKSCGLDFLDAEAIRAFEQAQPFPNPPPGLMASDATVRFPFGFFLEMSSGPSLHLFRSGG